FRTTTKRLHVLPAPTHWMPLPPAPGSYPAPAKREAGLDGWNVGIHTAPYASTVLAGYCDDEMGEWVVQLFVAERPTEPFTHWMIVTRPGEALSTSSTPADGEDRVTEDR